MVPRDQYLDSFLLTRLMTVVGDDLLPVVLEPLVRIRLQLAKPLMIDVDPHLPIGTSSGQFRCVYHCLQSLRMSIPGIKW